jgi:uncharacterized protein YbaP (TraB family)
MKLILSRAVALFPGLVWVLLGAAQGPSTNKAAKPKTATSKKTNTTTKQYSSLNQNTLLWEISGHGLNKPSYIFGTMHLICKEDAALSDNLKKAIAESDQVYFEIDLDDVNEMMSGLKYSRMTNYTKLSDLVTKEEYERIKKYFETHSSNIPFQMLERFKPAMLTSLLGKGACKEEYAMEMSIMDEAKKSNKEIKGLETSQYQAGLLDSIPYKDQAKELLNYIDSSEKYEKSTQELMEAYKKQDLKKLEELTNEEGGMEKYMDLLLYNRNLHWLQELQLILHSKPTVVAVGAGHLPGDKGMLSLLRKAGYTVKPVPNPPPVSKEKAS